MPIEIVIILAALMLLIATLYASVGHAGASGYLAAMALVGMSAAFMKPTSLALNVLVATITTIQFARAGCFSWRLFWPFALASIPMSFLGGRITLPGVYYRPLVGLLLLYSAVRLFATASRTAKTDSPPPPEVPPEAPPLPVALVYGGAIGLVSGLTGTGGGIFLSPLLLLANWSDTRRAAGVSAAFILANSIAGFTGVALTSWEGGGGGSGGGDSGGGGLLEVLPPHFALYAAAALIGGYIGSSLGSRRLPPLVMRRLLAAVLVIAAFKLLVVW